MAARIDHCRFPDGAPVPETTPGQSVQDIPQQAARPAKLG